MSTRILNVNERVQRQAKRIRQALGGADLNNVQAEAATEAAGYRINRNRIAQLRDGEVEAKEIELAVIAIVSGESDDFVRGTPYAFVRNEHDFRETDRAIPGYDNSHPIATGESADNLNPDYVHAPGEVCFVCVDDPDAHVKAEWLTPGGQIPNQMVIDLRDEALEKFLEGAA